PSSTTSAPSARSCTGRSSPRAGATSCRPCTTRPRCRSPSPPSARSLRGRCRGASPPRAGSWVPGTRGLQAWLLARKRPWVGPGAGAIPMASLRVPSPRVDDPSHTTSVYGGVVGYWTEEAAALAASQPSFGRIVLEAKKLTGYTEIPNELLQDSIAALEQFF